MVIDEKAEYRERYPHFAVTVDVAVMLVRDGRLHLLLVRRGEEPQRGGWALPGGFKRPDETLDRAAGRELQEETGVALLPPFGLRQFRAYGDPGRDPAREEQGVSVVTVVYLAAVSEVTEPQAGTDASGAQLWALEDVLNGRVELAFDHLRIVHEMNTSASGRNRQHFARDSVLAVVVHPIGIAFSLRSDLGGPPRPRKLSPTTHL